MTTQSQIPVSALANQTLSMTVGSQTVRLDIYQRSTGLFMNIWLNGVMVVAGAICLNLTWIARYPYLGLPGDFMFVDTQGADDPSYADLGTRYVLVYQSAS